MTLILCNKHGTSSFFESCEHIRELLKDKRYDEIKEIQAIVYHMKVCAKCIEKYGLEKYILCDSSTYDTNLDEPDEFWDDFEEAYDKMNNRIAWCARCYDELVL